MDVKSGERQLLKIFGCAERAGIGHAVYINFGTLLGCVRQGGLIPWDDDTDVSVMSDWITKEQEDAFYKELVKNNLFKHRCRHARRDDTGRALWWSLRSELHGCKSCIWFTFKWGGHVYHCKGKRWLKKIGNKPAVMELLPEPNNLRECSSIMKGNTAECFKSLVPVKFVGGVVNIPCGYGQLLDEYYPDWAIPRQGGASARYRLVLVKNWGNQKSWFVLQ